MSVGRICSRPVRTAQPNETIRDAARRMAGDGVGTLVILDPDGKGLPIGIVTDRDIVTRAVAPNLDAANVPVSRIMTVPVHTVREDADVEAAVELMSELAVRRLVVVDTANRLAGILALDDVIEALVQEAGAIGRLIPRHPPAVF